MRTQTIYLIIAAAVFIAIIYLYNEPLVIYKTSAVTGDMNGDGRLNSGDIRYLAMYVSSGGTNPKTLYASGDVNCDNKVDSGDVRYLAMFIASGGTNPLYSPLYPTCGSTICGNGICESGETATTCPADCGVVSSKIRNSKGKEWDAIAGNIQLAINDLAGAGDVWLPATTFYLSSNIDLKYSGLKLHGAGIQKTIFVLSNNARITCNSPLDNVEVDSFTFTGTGQTWFWFRNDCYIHDLEAYDTTTLAESGTIYVNTKDYGTIKNLKIKNCKTTRTSSHGIAIQGLSDICTFDGTIIENCTVSYAGYGNNHCYWACGFILGEAFSDGRPGGVSCGFTVKNMVVRNCKAEYSFESGFHFEGYGSKINNKFYSCTSNYNGRKLDEDPVNAYKYPYFCSGFLNIPYEQDTAYDCTANYNTYYGFYCGGGHLERCTATGNRVGNFATSCH